nr:LysR family transcriptional regulator [uncultured Duganella sp.]
MNLLGVFHALMESRSVTSAAQRFGITQPAMSNALARLRELLDDPLFVHAADCMQPTPYALEIADAVQGALQLIGQVLAHRKGFDPASSDSTFRFHMTDMGQINFLPLLIERLRTDAPGLSVEAETLELEQIRVALEEGRIHFAVGHLPKLGGRGIRSVQLLHERYDVLMRAEHPLAAAPLSKASYLGAAHAVVSSVGGGHRAIEESLLRRKARIVARVPNIIAVPMILARSDLIATVPRRVAKELARAAPFVVTSLPIDMPELEVSVFWHERFEVDPASIWMRALLIELFARPASDKLAIKDA